MTARTKTETGSVRQAIRWGLLLAAVATVGFRLPRLFHELRGWRESVRIGDASGAVVLRTFLLADSIGLLIVLVMGLAIFYALRPRAKSGP